MTTQPSIVAQQVRLRQCRLKIGISHLKFLEVHIETYS